MVPQSNASACPSCGTALIYEPVGQVANWCVRCNRPAELPVAPEPAPLPAVKPAIVNRPERTNIIKAPITSWSADELMALDFPAPRWAVEGILPEGLTLLAGKPKQGKSWLALALGIACASGGMALGNVEVVEGDVLYLALEDNPRRLKRRLLSLLQGQPPPQRLRLATACPRADQGGVQHVSEYLKRHPDARLVIVDTLARFRPNMRQKSQDSYAADSAALEPLQQLAGEHGVAVVVIHHVRKAQSEDWVDDVSGTLGLPAVADTTMVLQRQRGESTAVLKVTGRDVEESEHGLTFDPLIGSWRLLGYVPLPAEQQETINAVKRLNSATPTEFAEATGLKLSAAKMRLKRLEEDGHLQVQRGRYSVSADTHVTHVTQGSTHRMPRDTQVQDANPLQRSGCDPECDPVTCPTCGGTLAPLSDGAWCMTCRTYVPPIAAC